MSIPWQLRPREGVTSFSWEKPTHAAVYDRTENGEVFFIDSTHKDDPPINGVTRRSYPATDPKLKSWGRMLLEKRN